MPAASAPTSGGPRYCPLVLLFSAAAAGIVVDRTCPTSAGAWSAAATIALVIWLALALGRRNALASCVLLAAVLAAGGAWHHAYWRLYTADEVGRMVDEVVRPMVVEAVAMTSPRWSPAPPRDPLRTIPTGEQSEMLVWVTAVRDGRTFRSASGWATLEIDTLLRGVHAGDRLRIMAQAARPPAPLNPGEFDFSLHERSRRVGCRLFAEFPESVQVLARGSIWSPRRWLASVRDRGTAILHQYIAPDRATLASAILFGAREQLDPHRNERFLLSGTIHILCISGLHVGILAGGIFVVLRAGLVPRNAALAATIGLTVVYALIVDMQPPVMRAMVLVIIACLAIWLGRPAISFNSLAAAGIAVLVFNPASLFRAGPQLSFLAVATMIASQPWILPQPIVDPLDRLIAATRPWPVRAGRSFCRVVWRVWLTGTLIWLVSAPLVWKQYNLISPVAVIMSLVTWLPVPLVMYAGMGTVLSGSLLPSAGHLCGRVCGEALGVLERSIAWSCDWPGSHWWLAAPPTWWIALFYGALGLCFAFPALRLSRHWAVSLAAMWLGGALCLGTGAKFFSSISKLAARSPAPARPLVLHTVAVGHGLCVLAELPDGRNLLYDAGRLGSPLAGARPISAVLWSRGITHLDALVISHADADHFNAVPALLERFSVGAIYVSPVMFKRLPPAVKELHQSISRHGIPLHSLHGGQRLAAGHDLLIEVLHPPPGGILGSDNANSIVLLIEHAGRRMLLTGDLESPGLEDVLAEEPLDCDLVMAPHHGSPRSDPGGFADWSTPEHVLISGGRSLRSLAAIETVKHSFRLRGAEVYHTAEDGCLRIELSSAGVSVSTFRPHVRAIPVTAEGASLSQPE